MKRFLAILMATIMLFSFAACTVVDDTEVIGSGSHEYTTGYDETKYNAPGTFPVFKEKQTITAMLPDSKYVEDWDTNKQTLLYEKELNADLVFTILPANEYNTKVNLMTAAGGEEFTDAIIGSFGDGMVMNLADSGVIVPLTDYFYNKDVAHYLNEAIDRIDWNYYPYITMPDGEIYGVPKINVSVSQINNGKLWFYEPWFEAAGIDMYDIHTTEDFKNALLAVVKSDPNGNGKADEVGITSNASSHTWLKYIMCAFVYAGGDNFLYVNDGELGFAYQTEEWKEGLKYIKELYDLGLIDPLAFSQDSNSFKAMLNNSETIVTSFAGTAVDSIAMGDNRRLEYQCIPPLNSKWNDGKPLSVQSLPEPKVAFVVSSNASDPETVFRFGDLMVSEESSVHTRWGEKGVDWLEPKEGDVSMYEALGYEPYLIEVLPWAQVQNSHWFATGPFIRQKEISAGVVWTGEEIDTGYSVAKGQILYEGTGPEEDIVKLLFTEEESEITTEALATLNTYVNEMSAKFITGTEDIDAGWENFQTQLETMNVKGALECAQAAFDRMEALTK